MKRIRITRKNFILTVIVGALVLLTFVIANTIHSSRQTIAATDEAVSAVSSFYLEAMADRRSKTVTNLINNNVDQMKKALDFIRDEGVATQDELRETIGKVKALLVLNRFALVDEDNVVYTQYTTYSGGSRHDFLNDSEMDGLNISIVFPYGSPKQLCLAIPTENLTLAGKRMKACFVQIDINEIVDLLAFDDEGRTYFAIYAPGGENLSDTELGPFIAKQNIFEAISGVVAEGSLQKINKDFEKDIEGTMTFRANGVAETLSYVPVEGTDWEMAVLIRESVINERIRDISENSLDASRKQIASTLALVVLFGTVLLLELRIMANNRLAAEKANSKALKTMANTDALTGVRNKLAYSEQETALNHRISGGEIEELAVVVCDINGLKFVNDTEGHAAGDKLIKDASALICEYFDHGAVFRIGGDEFVVILQGRGFELMEEDVKAFNHKAEENIKKGGVVVSLGYSVFTPEDTVIHDVFVRADQMMYARKKALKEMGAHTRDSV